MASGAGAGAESKRPEPLHRTLRIGSKAAPVNYGPDDVVFSPSDMPEQARAARQSLRRKKRAVVLGADKKSWNQSTVLANNPMCKRQSRVLQAHDRTLYKYNYRAEKLPDAPPVEVTDVVRQQFRSTMRTTTRMADVPVHPDLETKPRWDGSTSFSTKAKGYKEATVTQAAMRNSRRHLSELKDYKDPVTLEREFLSTTRQLREKGLSDTHTSASKVPETDAGSGSTNRPISYTQTVSRKFHKYHHSGAYEKSKFEDGEFAWSCCMASKKNARGCIVTTVNPDAYNFASIN